jgi:hypothetical protein
MLFLGTVKSARKCAVSAPVSDNGLSSEHDEDNGKKKRKRSTELNKVASGENQLTEVGFQLI